MLSRIIREKPGLTLRRVIYLAYQRKQSREVKNSGQSGGKPRTILIYPALKEEQEISNLLNKIYWGLPASNKTEIYVPLAGKLSVDENSLPDPQSQRKYHKTNYSICFIPKSNISKYWNSTTILVHNYRALLGLLFARKIVSTQLIDKNFLSISEGSYWSKALYHNLNDDRKETILKNSRQNFMAMQKKLQAKNKAVCFLTGPSIDRYKTIKFSDQAIKIICNSNVKNTGLLEYINGPDIIVFADPVFHFGPSEYAARFRDQLIEVVKKYQPTIVVPEHTVPLLQAHHPELQKYLCGIPIHGNAFNFPGDSQFYVKATLNILTQFMMPVASALANEIYIIGADGRQSKEEYFWKFSPKAQFNDLLETVKDVHPSFFNDRNYQDYYQRHCTELEKLIAFGEARGKKYASLTKSYIPALIKRHSPTSGMA